MKAILAMLAALTLVAACSGYERCAGDPFASGRSRLDAGDVAGAGTEFRRAVSCDPEDDEARLFAAVTESAAALLDDPALRDLLSASGGSIRGSSSDACSMAIALPDLLDEDSPSSEEARRIATPILRERIDALIAELERLPGGFRMTLESSDLPACLRAVAPAKIEIDAADVLVALGGLRAAAAGLRIAAAYDVDADVDDVANNDRTPQEVVEQNPQLGNRRSDPASADALDDARTLLEQASLDLVDAIDAIAAETDDQRDDAISVAPEDRDGMERLRLALELFRTSLHEPVTFRAQDFPELDEDQRLDLRIFFDATIASLRPLLPPFTERGQFDVCRFPDPTFDGIAPDLTQENIDTFFGICRAE
ncbi:MAG: hypothetical protein ACREQY_17945 [Candidatus Binatia bacterium]